MKRITIIGARDSGTKNNPQVLADSLQAVDVVATVAYWEDLVFSIATSDVRVTKAGVPLFETAPDMVIAIGWYKSGAQTVYRDVAYSLALYLRHNHIPFMNSEMGQQRSTTKLSCMVQLALAGVPVPQTSFCLQAQQTVATQPLPFVAKDVAASRGKSNYLVKTEQDRIMVLAAGGNLMVQPFLPNDHDLRVICFGGAPSLILRRSRDGAADTHLNNTSQGGHGEWLPLDSVDPEILTNASRICKIMNRELAGIDFIPDSASSFGYSCLEVNAIPQLTSGFDVDKKLAAFVRAIT